MKKKLQKLPVLKNEDEERAFWDKHDATDYFDFSKGQMTSADAFHESFKPVTIRFSTQQLELIRRIATRMDVGYQSLIKVWLDERLVQEKYQRHM